MAKKTKQYLSFCPRTSIYTAQINGTPVKDPDTLGYYQITYDSGVGTLADVRAGMTLDVGTTPGGRDIGSVRLRKAPTSTIFYIAETSPGELPLADNHYLTVRDEFRLWQVMPRLVGKKNNKGYTTGFKEYHDYDVVYSNQNKVIEPLVNVEYRRAGMVDPGETYRTVTLDMTYTIMSVGATLTSITWSLGDTTIVTGTINDPDITIQVPASPPFRHIYVTVVDSLGGTKTKALPLWAHDDDNPAFTSFKVMNDETSLGREMVFEVFGDPNSIDQTILAKDAMICYWEEPSGFTDPNYRYEYLGWSRRDAHKLKRHKSRYSIETMGPQGFLDLFSGFPQTINSDDTPSKWYELQDVTINRTIHYLLRRYTTFLTMFNLYLPVNTVESKAETVKQGTFWAQISEQAKGYYGNLACDSQGHIWDVYHYSYLEDADRALRPALYAYSPEDWKDAKGLEIPEELIKPVGWVKGAGSWFDGSKSRQLESRAPGLAMSYGAQRQDAPYQRLPSTDRQKILNRLTGHHWARMNNPYPRVTLELIEPDDVLEPAWGEPVSLTWSYPTPQGFLFASHLFLVTRVGVTHNYERGQSFKTITLTLEGVTKGLEGQRYVPPKYPQPTVDPLIINPITFPFPGIVTPPFGYGYDWGDFPTGVEPVKLFAVLGIAHATGTVQRATSWNPVTGICAWEGIGGTSTGVTGTGIWGTSDPWDYRRRFVLTTDGLFRCDDIWAATPTWTQVATNLQMFGNASILGTCLRMSINREGYIVVSSIDRVVYTFDYGASWNVAGSPFNGAATGASISNSAISFAISPRNSLSSGRLYGFTHRFVSPNSWCRLWRSDDWGATWTFVADHFNSIFGPYTNATVHIPYVRLDGSPNANDASQLVYIAGGYQLNFFGRSQNAGASLDLSDQGGNIGSDYAYCGTMAFDGIHTYTLDPNIITCLRSITGGARMGYATDGGAPLSQTIVFGAGNNSDGATASFRAGIHGWPTDPNILLTYGHNWLRYFPDVIGSPTTAISLTTGLPSSVVRYAEWDLSDFIAPLE